MQSERHWHPTLQGEIFLLSDVCAFPLQTLLFYSRQAQFPNSTNIPLLCPVSNNQHFIGNIKQTAV